jgi:hypothetical protein
MTATSSEYFVKSEAEALIQDEQDFIAKNRDRGGFEDWNGIALSGGGIRSAIFCLGALQALAAKNIMPRFDYISSVSGGGYIASALQWAWRKDPASGTSAQTFPFGASKNYRSNDAQKDARLTYLRTHGQYLIPDEQLSIWSLTAVVIRTFFLNLSVWIPIGAFLLFMLIVVFRLFEQPALLDLLPNFLAPVMASRWSACPEVQIAHGNERAIGLRCAPIFLSQNIDQKI